MATNQTGAGKQPTPLYDKMKEFYQKMGEAVKIALGPKVKGPDDNAILSRKEYLQGAKAFVGGVTDENALGALTSVYTNPLMEISRNFQVDPIGVAQTDEFRNAIGNLQRPLQDPLYIKPIANELGYKVDPKESDKILVGKVLRRLGGDLQDLLEANSP